jgi:hypothetical protein
MSDETKKAIKPQFESQIMMQMLGAITMMYDALANAVTVSDFNQRIIQSQVIKCKEMIETLYQARKET